MAEAIGSFQGYTVTSAFRRPAFQLLPNPVVDRLLEEWATVGRAVLMREAAPK